MIPSLEGWPTKTKEAPSPHEVRLIPLDTNPVFLCLGEMEPKIKSEVICLHHHKYFIYKYSQFQNFCCDPFQKHSVYAKTNLLVLEFDHVKKYKGIKHDLVPGKKICRKCKGELDNVFDMQMENRKDPDYVDEESKFDYSVLYLNT